ncbi:MAG: hypothetical protein K9L74_00885 [Candidatus Izimaplasma sp.]|nr:hypothetical protein [Candidatus Izimaplasma bacterium]
MIKRKASKLIDYPNCLNRTMFDFVDIMGLKLIAELEIKDEKEDALNKLIRILENRNTIYINSETRHILPTLYASVAILLGRLDKYEKSLGVAEEGIKLSLHYNDHSALAHLYYMKGVSLKRVGTATESKKYLGKAIIVAIIKDSEEETKMFKKAVKDHFGIETDDAIINTLKSAI